MTMSFIVREKSGRWLLAGACAFGVITLMPFVPATAQSSDTTSRLERLERDMDTLNRSVFKGEKPSSAPAPYGAIDDGFQDRVNAFERDLRDLTGRSEELQNQLRNLNNTLNDLGTRMTALEARVGTAAISPSDASPSIPVSDPRDAVSSDPSSPVSIAPSLPVPVTPNAPAPSNSPTVEPLGNLSMSSETGQAVVSASDPTLAYENAMTMLKHKDYTGAEKAFSDFLTAFKDHQLAPNARYWLGETYFAQQKYDQSARVFAEGYQQAPKGPKAADNLLKLGLSLAATGNTTDACIALGQISKDFASGASAVRSRAVSEMKRMKCPGA